MLLPSYVNPHLCKQHFLSNFKKINTAYYLGFLHCSALIELAGYEKLVTTQLLPKRVTGTKATELKLAICHSYIRPNSKPFHL